jgi:hypothetical protein
VVARPNAEVFDAWESPMLDFIGMIVTAALMTLAVPWSCTWMLRAAQN